jgi:dTDP-4-amino-4,6-dideoxygalactose transaminase
MFSKISEFEKEISAFTGSPYSVATDCCTHAIELCLRYTNVDNATCPTNTYLSIPMTFIKLGIDWNFQSINWSDYYYITDNIIDAAVYWKKNCYIKNTLMCLSFQYKKHLSLGRGGAILCNTYEEYINLKKMSYDGRLPDVPWKEQNINTIGYHYYMTPETAELGLSKLPDAIKTAPKQWSYKDYVDLREMEIFDVLRK